jgi:hypothetical protein
VHKRLVIAVIALGAIACRGSETTEPYAGQEAPDGQTAPDEETNPDEGIISDEGILEDEETSPTPAGEEQPVGEVVKDPAYGERVTVEGEVDQVYGERVFTMKARLFQDDLLVVAPQGVVYDALTAPNEVQVVGEVRKMVVSEAEREFTLTFDNAVKVKWENRPYVVAESITRVKD